MKKSDLKTGDLVQLRNGQVKIVIGDALVGLCDDIANFTDLLAYSDDLRVVGVDTLDIMKVRNCDNRCPFRLSAIEALLRGVGVMLASIKWDWEREKVKEVTMAEVEEKFGCKVKIVKE